LGARRDQDWVWGGGWSLFELMRGIWPGSTFGDGFREGGKGSGRMWRRRTMRRWWGGEWVLGEA